MKPKIEKDVPIPDGYNAPSKYDWIKDLDTGDSFIWSSYDVSSVRQRARKLNIELTQRIVGMNKVRVWITKSYGESNE